VVPPGASNVGWRLAETSAVLLFARLFINKVTVFGNKLIE